MSTPLATPLRFTNLSDKDIRLYDYQSLDVSERGESSERLNFEHELIGEYDGTSSPHEMDELTTSAIASSKHTSDMGEGTTSGGEDDHTYRSISVFRPPGLDIVGNTTIVQGSLFVPNTTDTRHKIPLNGTPRASTKRLGGRQRITVFITPLPQESSSSELPQLYGSLSSDVLDPLSPTLQNVPKYHFSRYFLRQLLVICRIKPNDADNTVTRVKEFLIDSGLYNITQWHLERILFDVLSKNHAQYKSMTPKLFRVVNRFQASRGALVVVVTGTPCFGRPMVPLKLAERLNVTNVVRTQVVANVLSFPLRSPPIPEGNTEDEMLRNFKIMCKTVEKGLSGDLEKARYNGKSVLFEGLLIDPALYLDLFTPIDCIRVKREHHDMTPSYTRHLSSLSISPYHHHSINNEFTSNTSPKSFPVVVVPFLLVGPIDLRQVQQSQNSTESNIDRPLKTLEVIDQYLRQYQNHLNVVHVESHEVSEAKLDEMHSIVLEYLQRSFELSGF